MYIKVIDGKIEKYPYSLYDLCTDNPNVSFPKEMSDSDLFLFNVERVVPAIVPTNLNNDEKVVEETPVYIDGMWRQVFKVVKMSSDELSKSLELTAKTIRSQRDTLLYDSDWTQLNDAPISQEQKEAWKNYRQRLRDMPNNEKFPLVVAWPTPPQT